MRKKGGRGGAGAPRTADPLCRSDGFRPRLWEAQEKELRGVGEMLPGLIRRGLGAVEPGGSVTVVITATRTHDPDMRVELQVVLTPKDPAECESFVADLTGPMRGLGAQRLALSRNDHDFVKRATEQILIRLDDHDLDVAGLARALHTSPSQLGRRLRVLVDRSPAEMIRLVRLLRARQLMDVDGASLSSIAHACGFSDQAHFTRTFRRYFGCAPSELRRSSCGVGLSQGQPEPDPPSSLLRPSLSVEIPSLPV